MTAHKSSCHVRPDKTTPSLGKDHDLLLAFNSDDPGVAVGLTRVVDKPRLIPGHCGIHYQKVIDVEHIAPDVLKQSRRT